MTKAEPVIAAETPEKLHPLLVGIKPHFAKTRDADNGVLRPYKRLMADIQSSAEGLDVAVRAADKLYRALTARGHRATLAPPGELSRDAVDLSGGGGGRDAYRSGWWPERPTVVYVGEVPIGLSLFEMTVSTEMLYTGDGTYVPTGTLTQEQRRRMTGPRYWTTTRDFASGRLCLQAYCPSRMVTWVKRWPETKHGQFGSMLPAIVTELEAVAPELTKKVEAAQIEAEERRKQWEEEARRRREAEERAHQERRRKEARDELLVAIARWDETRRVLSYFAEVEVAASNLEAEARALLMERLQRARQLIGELAPLELLQRWRAPDERR